MTTDAQPPDLSNLSPARQLELLGVGIWEDSKHVEAIVRRIDAIDPALLGGLSDDQAAELDYIVEEAKTLARWMRTFAMRLNRNVMGEIEERV